VSSKESGFGRKTESQNVCPSMPVEDASIGVDGVPFRGRPVHLGGSETTTSAERRECGERTELGTKTEPGSERTGKRLFDSERAREAGRLSAIARREKAERRRIEEATDPTDEEILRKLRREARAGDKAAAKEAREWERHIASKGGDFAGLDLTFDELDPHEQERLLVALTREICGELGIGLTDEQAADPHYRIAAPPSITP
jgi:hypothetical protein